MSYKRFADFWTVKAQTVEIKVPNFFLLYTQSLANMFPNMATNFWPCWCRSNQRSKVVILCGPLDLYKAVGLLPMHSLSLHPKHTFGLTHSQRPPCDDCGFLTTRRGQLKLSASSRIMWLAPGENSWCQRRLGKIVLLRAVSKKAGKSLQNSSHDRTPTQTMHFEREIPENYPAFALFDHPQNGSHLMVPAK